MPNQQACPRDSSKNSNFGSGGSGGPPADRRRRSCERAALSRELPPFATLTLKVGASTAIMHAPPGRRVLVDFVDATLEGPRLRARKIEGTPAGDGLSVSSDVAVLDIRVFFRTDEGATIAMHMVGRADATKFQSGGPVTVAATFEADDSRLRWLNLAVVAGTGGVVGTDALVVELFEVR